MICSLVGNNTIIFHYQKSVFNNKKNSLLVSTIDENNNFLNQYLLVYNKTDYYKSHFNEIKNNFNNYIQSIAFVNNIAPITINGYKEIGFIIQLTNSTKPNPQLEDEYIPPIPIVFNDIKQDFISKPLIGLENIGATCYMNATLQCLCNILYFVNYFKYNKELAEIVKADVNKEKLCSAFKLLIENLYPYKLSKNYQKFLADNPNVKKDEKAIQIKYYAPRNFKDNISRMNPLFKGIAANDAKDLVNFLLMTLHEELNPIKSQQVLADEGNIFQDQTNQALMFQSFYENFQKNYKSIISKLFYALNCNLTQCSNCSTITYNYQIYFFLIFPLEEVRKFKLNNNNNNGNYLYLNNNNNPNSNMVDIYDCFEFDRRINYMMGDNSMYCNYCKQTCFCSMKTVLTTGPEILVIILNRGKGIQFNVKINFYLDLNLSQFIELGNTGCNYELFGVITHIGESGMSGHFIAYCKDLWSKQWLKYNDAFVSKVQNFKNEVIDFAMPYLLFYQKKH